MPEMTSESAALEAPVVTSRLTAETSRVRIVTAEAGPFHFFAGSLSVAALTTTSTKSRRRTRCPQALNNNLNEESCYRETRC
jgi:hypothetical protein